MQRVELNPTELCNLKCSFCPRSSGYPNRNLHMSTDTCKKIREHLDNSNYRNLVSITGRGEPTLTTDFDKILDILLGSDPQYRCYMYTNGKKLHLYEDYIDRFWKVYVDVYKDDLTYYKQQVEYYKQYKNVQVLYKPDRGVSYIECNNTINTKFSNRGGYLDEHPTGSSVSHPCAFIFQKMFINWNGDYNLCCDDWKQQIVLSNVYEQSIEEYINNNKLLSKYRQHHLDGLRNKLNVCNNCNRSYKLKTKIHEDLLRSQTQTIS